MALGAGRLHPQKNFATLIRAFAAVRRERAPRLIILGEGKERERLVALGVSGDVALPGFDPNPFAYMSRAAVFVLSSRYEELPGVLIQALARGVLRCLGAPPPSEALTARVAEYDVGRATDAYLRLLLT